MKLQLKIIPYTLLGMLLGGCAEPLRKPTPQPRTAAQLAAEVLPLTDVVGAMPLPPEIIPPPPREFNQRGGLPTIAASAAEQPLLPPPAAGAEDVVMLDLEQVELREVLENIADELKISLVIDSSIADKVTLRTAADKPLKRADLWPLLQLLLTDAGITMEKKGNVYHLKKVPQALPPQIGGLSAGLEHSNAPEVMQITPLSHINLESAATAIKPLIDPQGRLVMLPNLNLLGIITSPDRLQRVNKLLSLIDADPFTHRGLRLYRLLNSKASEAQPELEKIMQAVEGPTPSYQVIGLERINALLVVAPPNRGFDHISQWVSVLDERGDSGNEQIFIYKVRNLKASALASTLSSVFSLEQKDNKTPKKPATPLDPNQPPEIPPALQPPATPTLGGNGVSAELKVNIVADEDTNSLLVRGSPRDYRQLLTTIAQLDQVPKEVMVNVVVAEVSLNESTRFGIDWSYWFGNRSFVGTNFGVQGDTRANPGSVDAAFDAFNFGNMTGLVINQVGSTLTSMLNLVATDNNIEVLSRPSLLVKNNQEATINVGSDQPTVTRINTQNATTTTPTGSNFLTTNEVQYRQVGIILKVKPHINDDGIVNMEISQEVSQLSKNAGIEGLPAFDQRKIETAVVVRDGSAIVLGGLIETRNLKDNSGIPGLRDVPLAGSLFGADSKDLKRTELVVIIVPQIVNPEADNRRLVQLFTERMRAVVALMQDENMVIFDTPVPPLPAVPPTQQNPAPPPQQPAAPEAAPVETTGNENP
jgi:general secretion pathway protein D